MSAPRYSIGIDLGTTNSALAFEPFDASAASAVLPIAQWDAPGIAVEATTLPSFLYLPDELSAAEFGGSADGWIVGRAARARAADAPGRVVHSAKSWLAHHGADRSAAFLPWGSTDLAAARKISPVHASALILGHLREAWNERFAADDAAAAFDAQTVTVTVPASFDAAAQRLTIEAARQAGFPPAVRLLEEPQAALYRRLEARSDANAPWTQIAARGPGRRHLLVVDIGGGTSDFSLFALEPGADANGAPRLERIAVSDHILLGGDNMDLAVARRLEPQLAEDGLSGGAWGYLVARSRTVKERALSTDGAPDESFAVALPGRGSGLIASTRAARITRAEIERLVIDGFFPEVGADEYPLRTKTALGEWGLPYAADPAVTRHLADFLRDRPPVDAVLFNGGALHPIRLRERIRALVGAWQRTPAPIVLENPEPDLAVARGAARFGTVLASGVGRIAAGTAHAIFLHAHRAEPGGNGADVPLVCVLPRNAPAERTFEIDDVDLALRLNVPVRFQTYSSTRHGRDRAGDVVALNDRDFRPLPPLETVARTAGGERDASEMVSVNLTARLSELGRLEVACTSADPALPGVWPLDFNLRALPEREGAGAPAAPEAAIDVGPNAGPAALAAARARIETLFGQPINRRDKLTATRLTKSLELLLGMPKAEWNLVLVRSLWSTLQTCGGTREISAEHEEAWLIMAGFFLRPGFGAALDDVRIDELWTVRERGLCFPTKAVQIQEYIVWRRVGGGLSAERQTSLVAPAWEAIFTHDHPAPELVLLAGALERLDAQTKGHLIDRFLALAVAAERIDRHTAHYLAALGLLLNRTPLYAGPETVVPAARVEQAFEAVSNFAWSGPKLVELQGLFVRAARVVNDRNLDVAKGLRNRIADKLERGGVPPSKTAPLRNFVALERADRISVFGESLPPGLVLRG